jgi:hypothetical protein
MNKHSYFGATVSGVLALYLAIAGAALGWRDNVTPAEQAVGTGIVILAGAAAILAFFLAAPVAMARAADGG